MLRTFKNNHFNHECTYTREKGKQPLLYTGVFIKLYHKFINILKSKISEEVWVFFKFAKKHFSTPSTPRERSVVSNKDIIPYYPNTTS